VRLVRGRRILGRRDLHCLLVAIIALPITLIISALRTCKGAIAWMNDYQDERLRRCRGGSPICRLPARISVLLAAIAKQSGETIATHGELFAHALRHILTSGAGDVGTRCNSSRGS